jgi:hypothetical protein
MSHHKVKTIYILWRKIIQIRSKWHHLIMSFTYQNTWCPYQTSRKTDRTTLWYKHNNYKIINNGLLVVDSSTKCGKIMPILQYLSMINTYV